MNRGIKWFVYSIMSLLPIGCYEDTDTLRGGKEQPGMPVQFTTAWPQGGSDMTRAIEDKKEFTDFNVIHVSAEFTLDSGTTESGNEETVTKYTILTLENGKWVNKRTEPEFEMSWPWNATHAKFTAYYLENWNGPITKVGQPLEPVVLDRFEYKDRVINPDPLEAETDVIEYGHAVHLEFHHLCARLTIVGVEDEEEYGLRFKSIEDRELKNACTMERTEENELKFWFVTEESKKISSQVDKEGEKRSVSFHLEPGDYRTFTLVRRNGNSYITISNVEELNDLQAGVSYTVSLEDLKGNITPDDSDNWWKEPTPEEPVKDFEIGEFLQAIKECNHDYTCTVNGQVITLLQKHPYRNEITLMADLDFGFESFTSVNLPDIVTFNGGGYSISGLGYPMFGTVFGTVKDLDLRRAELVHEGTPSESSDANHDTGWGVLARVCEGGTISDVSLSEVKLKIILHNDDVLDKAYNVGALVGFVPKGSLNNIRLSGNIQIEVEEYNDQAAYIACVGGVVGQCAGALSKIDNLGGNSTIEVRNHCQGHGSRYSGGVVGLLAGGSLEGCNVRTVVHAEEAEGVWNYAGGVAGAVRMGGRISNATVSGSVTGGIVSVYKETNTHSSTGGIVGHVDKASVRGGAAFNHVAVSPEYPNNPNNPNNSTTGPQTWYTIGGVIGAMAGAVKIENNEGRNVAFDTTPYLGKNHYVAGTFTAGIGKEEELKGAGNSADGTGNFIGWGN